MLAAVALWHLLGCASHQPGPAADAPGLDRAVGCARDTAAPTTGATFGDTAPGPESADTATLPAGRGDLVVYAVRHAEKASDEGDDPGLTEEGRARAEALRELVTDVPLVAAYASDLRRTQETLAPTAEAHGLPVVAYPDPDEALAAHLLATHRGQVVVHAGHTDTLPGLLAGLGLADAPSVSGYGQLWLVRVDGDGCATVTMGRYGE